MDKATQVALDRFANAPPLLQGSFHKARNTASDINEHLEVLQLYAAQCEHVTEFGLRGGQSTIALLAAQPETFISYDINPFAVISQHVANLLSMTGRTSFQPRVGDTLKILIEPTDMLFIDTLHTAKQLWAELERHADPERNTVRKFLAFHDTVSFGDHGEDGTSPGLRASIRHFQRNHAFPIWELVEDRKNNNGLVVLKNLRAKEN